VAIGTAMAAETAVETEAMIVAVMTMAVITATEPLNSVILRECGGPMNTPDRR
jgi:hypothetical protein